MNLLQLYNEMEKDPDFWSQNIQHLPLTLVEINQTIGQARVTGHIPQHINTMVTNIGDVGQRVPITVERDGKGFIVMDGNHRVEALRILAETYPESAKFKTVMVLIKTFNSDAERMEYQALANEEHLPARKNDKHDIAYQIRRLQSAKDPAVPMPPTSQKEHRKYEKDLRTFIKSRYTTSDTTAIINELFETVKNQKLQNITKGNLEKMFASWKGNKLNWAGNADNKTNTGWNVYTSPTHGGYHPQKSMVSYTFKAKSSAAPGALQNAVIIWDNNCRGRDEKHIDDYRVGVVESWNKANSSQLLKRGKKLVDKIFIAPQKLDSDCKEENFFEVEVKNNKFITKTIPKSGWVN